MSLTSDVLVQDVKGIKQSFDDASKLALEQFKDSRIFRIENTTQYFEIFTSTEGMTGSKELAENETPPTLSLQDGRSVTLTNKRFGSAIEISSTMRSRMLDGTVEINSFLQREKERLIRDNTHLFITNAHKMLNEAFDSTSDFLAPDSVELCGAHTWTSGKTFDNSATATLDADAVDTAVEFGADFSDSTGQPFPQNYDTIIVKMGSAAHRQALRLFAVGINPTAVADINIYEGGTFTIIATPFITTANKLNWFMMDSSVQSPLYMGITKAPTMEEPIVQNNGAIRSNVEAFYKEGVVNMPYMIYGSDGSA